MGDERTYESVVALRAVESTDGMTADWCHLPYEFLARVSNRIINTYVELTALFMISVQSRQPQLSGNKGRAYGKVYFYLFKPVTYMLSSWLFLF